ncbi:MAG TPA: thermopsin family protease [Thermoplasmata archaeon]|nr:thermopsin family protease [Thermoplasmata archaeon]
MHRRLSVAAIAAAVALALLLTLPSPVTSGAPAAAASLPGPAHAAGPMVRSFPGSPDARAPTASLTDLAAYGRSAAVGGGHPGAGGVPGLASAAIFPPGPSVQPGAPVRTLLTTAFSSTPAPMGISDLGVATGGTPYSYGTRSFEGQLVLTQFAAFTPTNVTDDDYQAPNWVALQLNTVAVNVSHFTGTTAGTFWIQNGVHFNGTTLQFADNIWNFSGPSPALPPATLEGTHGEIEGHYVYVGGVAPITVTAPSPADPLTLELINSINSSSGSHTVVTFGYYLHDGATTIHGIYDTVTFNGSATAAPSQFEVDGSTTNGAGHLNDAEFILGGNGGGSNANVVALNGTESLLRWSGKASDYLSIPAAYDFGADSSETSLGVAESYTGTTVHLSQGPSFLYGLWNTTSGPIAPAASPGWIHIRLTVQPSYAIVFATNRSLSEGPLDAAQYSFAPTDRAGALATNLPPPASGEPYVFNAWADGFLNGSVAVSDNSTATSPASVVLIGSPTTVEAPVYLLGSAQAMAFGEAGVNATTYSPSPGALALNPTTDALAAPFRRVNDYNYSTFQLVVVQDVNLSVSVDDFRQTPSTFSYTNELGTPRSLPYWTQGYFFYGGRGRFSVQNVTIGGAWATNPSLAPTLPPATIEYDGVTAPVAANITSIGDAVGISIFDSSGATVEHLAAEGGSLGLYTSVADSLLLAHANTSGPRTARATLANLTSSSTITVEDVVTGVDSSGLDLYADSDLTITGVTVEDNGLGLFANDSSSATVTDLLVELGSGSTAGTWANGSALTFDDVTVNGGVGLALVDDRTVSLTDGTASGYLSSVVRSFAGSTGGTFSAITAELGAAGVVLNNCSVLTLSTISASNGSVGAVIFNATTVQASDVESTIISIGLWVNLTTTDTFSAISTTVASAGVIVQNSTSVRLTTLTGSNASLDAKPYFNNGTGPLVPKTPVGLVNDSGVTISGVSTIGYPFAVWSNNSTGVSVSTVVSLYGGEAVALNQTNSSTVSDVFAFSDLLGISLAYCSKTLVSDSTFELSATEGAFVNNGSHDNFSSDNFVANNGSSVNGTFNLTHDQALVANATATSFRGNFWSDRPSTGSYTINKTAPVRDGSPSKTFTTTYVEFVEHGLPVGSPWTLEIGGSRQAYTMNESVLYLPGWALPNGPLAFSVVPILAFPAHPSSGSLSWSGTSLSQLIVFGNLPSSSAPTPWWLYAAVGGAAAVAAIAAVVVLRRRARRRAARGHGSEWTPDPPA